MRWFLFFVSTITMAIAQNSTVEGNLSSAVRVIAYEDLQCPDCAAYRRMMDEKLLPAYGATVAFEHREFPLPKHKWARPASIAARYFASVDPKLGVTFRRYCAERFLEITPENFAEKLREFASKNNADPEKAVASLKDAKLAQLVEEDYQEGIARGVAKTPTIFVNGEPFIEHFSFEDVAKSIDAALASTRTTK